MTGIDRLRAIAGAWDEWGLGGTLAEMADQIERERACDADTIENIRLIVGGVVDEMEHHILGHEGMEDSPVARWARELRGALKSDTSDERGAQNPSWHDPADAADVTSDAPKVTRDPAEDVSMSAYDLLPQEDREAIAWVREHGGLSHVKEEWNHSRNLKRPAVLAADGKPLESEQTVWDANGDELVVVALEDGGNTVTCRYADVGDGIPVHGMWSPSQLTHQRPDSWDRLEEDAEKDPCGYFGFDGEETCGKCPASGKNCEQTMALDIVRRAKALAGRDR